MTVDCQKSADDTELSEKAPPDQFDDDVQSCAETRIDDGALLWVISKCLGRSVTAGTEQRYTACKDQKIM